MQSPGIESKQNPVSFEGSLCVILNPKMLTIQSWGHFPGNKPHSFNRP